METSQWERSQTELIENRFYSTLITQLLKEKYGDSLNEESHSAEKVGFVWFIKKVWYYLFRPRAAFRRLKAMFR